MPRINGNDGNAAVVNVALGQPIPAPARRRRKPLPMREIQAPTKWARALVYYNSCALSDGPLVVEPKHYYLTDRKLDGLVTLRYTDVPLVPCPERRDPGTRYLVYGMGDKPCYALLARDRSVLDVVPQGDEASAFRLLPIPPVFPIPTQVVPEYYDPGRGINRGSRRIRFLFRTKRTVRDCFYRWLTIPGTLPPKPVPSSTVRWMRQQIQATPTAHEFNQRVDNARVFNSVLEAI